VTSSEPIRPQAINVDGELVALGPQRRELMPLYQRWLNDWVVMAPLGATLRSVTAETEEQLYAETGDGRHQARFTVYARETWRPVGLAGLQEIAHDHGTAEFVIFLGEREAWGRGYGTETARLLLRFGFGDLGLRAVWLRVFDFNERGIRAYRRAGFREVGRRRWAFRLGDRIADVILMECRAGDL